MRVAFGRLKQVVELRTQHAEERAMKKELGREVEDEDEEEEEEVRIIYIRCSVSCWRCVHIGGILKYDMTAACH